MFPESPLSKNTSGSTSPPSLLSSMEQSDNEGPEEQEEYTSITPQPLPCWATQALCDLAHSETQLRRVREQQSAEAEAVTKGLERAVLGAQREERRLLERVEQDHRDLQRRLEQLQRDNGAALRVSQALVEQRLRRISQLRDLVQKSNDQCTDVNRNGVEVEPRHDAIQRDVLELIQPWEVSLALKRVSFKPSAQPQAVLFGEVKVQNHCFNFPVTGHELKAQTCSIHGMRKHGTDPETIEKSSPNGSGFGQDQDITSSDVLMSQMYVRKHESSTKQDEESEKDAKAPFSQMAHCSQEPSKPNFSREECGSAEFAAKDELFLPVPSIINNVESEREDLVHLENEPALSYGPHGAKSLSNERCIQEQGHHFSNDFAHEGLKTDGASSKRKLKKNSQLSHGSLPSRQSLRDLISSHSCHDLSNYRPLSRLSTSSDDHAHNRAPSPAESVDSGYTFIVSSPRTNTARYPRLSRSNADLSHINQPSINGKPLNKWKATMYQQSSKRNQASKTKSCPSHEHCSHKELNQHARHSWGFSRSQSMSVLNRSSQDRLNQHTGTEKRSKDIDKSEPGLLEFGEDPRPVVGKEPFLVRQFGKQGSGRSDLTLPSGLHTTAQGQLFLVDCGNARVQVMDQYGNVFQQVTSSNDIGNARFCHNFFDVAVNSKGLIALSCTSERALLIFNRHGRRLQTFGGTPCITGMPRDELEAPRGVTVTRKDEFLVADIRRGTLTAMKLEPKTGSRLERTLIPGFQRPYLVAVCLYNGLVAVSERGGETGQQPCVKVLGPNWNTLRILGVCSGMGPVLTSPWGICIDREGVVLVADWAEQHRVVLYPPNGPGHIMVAEGLSSPRGLGLLPNGLLVVSDSMHHCIKIYKYK